MILIVSAGSFHTYFDPTLINSTIPINVYKEYQQHGRQQDMSALFIQLQHDAQQRGFSLFGITPGYHDKNLKDCFITLVINYVIPERDW